jgi:DNA replication ATP-dependent helicase Dna2
MKQLADTKPKGLVKLASQYRMHQDICDICNQLTYGGALSCADEFVASTLLQLRNFPDKLPKPTIRQRQPLRSLSGNTATPSSLDWLRGMVDPNNVVVFGNSDHIIASKTHSHSKMMPAQSAKNENGIYNKGKTVNMIEVNLVACCVQAFISCGAAANDIGIICPYRAQVSDARRLTDILLCYQ